MLLVGLHQVCFQKRFFFFKWHFEDLLRKFNGTDSHSNKLPLNRVKVCALHGGGFSINNPYTSDGDSWWQISSQSCCCSWSYNVTLRFGLIWQLTQQRNNASHTPVGNTSYFINLSKVSFKFAFIFMETHLLLSFSNPESSVSTGIAFLNPDLCWTIWHLGRFKAVFPL